MPIRPPRAYVVAHAKTQLRIALRRREEKLFSRQKKKIVLVPVVDAEAAARAILENHCPPPARGRVAMDALTDGVLDSLLGEISSALGPKSAELDRDLPEIADDELRRHVLAKMIGEQSSAQPATPAQTGQAAPGGGAHVAAAEAEAGPTPVDEALSDVAVTGFLWRLAGMGLEGGHVPVGADEQYAPQVPERPAGRHSSTAVLIWQPSVRGRCRSSRSSRWSKI